MANELLIATGSLCLLLALIEAWVLVAVSFNPKGALSKLIPIPQDVIKSHVDFLMMSQFLFVFYLLFKHFGIQPCAVVIVCMCLGAVSNPFLFLVRAVTPPSKSPPTTALRLCLLYTSPSPRD